MEPVLQIESLKKYYGKSKNQTKALDGITSKELSWRTTAEKRSGIYFKILNC